ncbi:VanZ family protein [Limnohabitans sp. 15K]|uniref:VanZ family protein n=1 Tax=Limnohabitans sp. 15K TaxID=1100706 RepID=UPI000C1F16E3|nr:VanZ family protein [Limnohabitans sp. 15K]PIT83680.1 VanZ family protein [Limnohabitans sp. 15K]
MRTDPQRKTAAWPLVWVYAILIVYASLYPFDQWRLQGIAPWLYLTAPLPRYWTAFDVLSNVLGYAPLGFLLALALHRTRPEWPTVWVATLAAAALSLTLEAIQMFLPVRVPSNVDAALNIMGALAGASMARALAWAGLMDRWSRFRDRWFVPDSSGALALLAVWPLALLFPAPVTFGLGQVLERFEAFLAYLLEDSPMLEWLPLREVELQPLLPVSEVLCVAIGLLLPCLLAFGVLRRRRQRMAMAVLLVLIGFLASALSAALTYGPAHTWDWVTPEVWVGLAMAVLGMASLSFCTARVCWVLALAALVWQLSLLNNASADAYFALTLQTWEQGRFIRFHGLSQWLGWLWPYALLFYLVSRLSSNPQASQA